VKVLNKLPALMETTLKNSIKKMKALAKEINKWDDMYCLGYAASYPIALEGALKLKEITYAHCEGMLSTEFKHGPLSAVIDGYPILFVAPPDYVPLIVSGINEVTCRGGRAIVIGEDAPALSENASNLITLPKTNPGFSSILSIIPLQLLSYEMSVARGYDPDFPRNLSKTLTVD
jgi:glutamine---fructose-6-phosphate transaminase (isomerizing)